jgi:transposase
MSKKRLPAPYGLEGHDGVSTQPSAEEEVSMSTITIGVDLAKNLFSICEMDGVGRVTRRQDLRRDAFAAWLAQLPVATVVAMEACSGAHHWARRCLEHGLQPKIIAAQFVSPFRKQRTTKNDRNDAEAIATAARQGNMRFVPVKSIDQQARLSWHRVREGYKVEHLAVANRLRGLLAEFGIVVAKRDAVLRAVLADAHALNALPASLRELLRGLVEHWQSLKRRIDACDAHIAEQGSSDGRCQRVRAIIGIGPITADAVVATIGSAREFKKGRQLAAWLGLVPTQHSSGGHTRLGTISCRGDAYLRTLLIQGARSSLQRAKRVAIEASTPEQLWIRHLASRMPFGKVLVAIANKHARQIWAMLAREETYDADAWTKHPMVQRPAGQQAASRTAMG